MQTDDEMAETAGNPLNRENPEFFALFCFLNAPTNTRKNPIKVLRSRGSKYFLLLDYPSNILDRAWHENRRDETEMAGIPMIREYP
jgi:hypothetical protein